MYCIDDTINGSHRFYVLLYALDTRALVSCQWDNYANYIQYYNKCNIIPSIVLYKTN